MDSAGTLMMSELADVSGGSLMSANGITGLIAIILMTAHAVWATVVLVRKDDKAAHTFHRFSISA